MTSITSVETSSGAPRALRSQKPANPVSAGGAALWRALTLNAAASGDAAGVRGALGWACVQRVGAWLAPGAAHSWAAAETAAVQSMSKTQSRRMVWP